MHVGRIGHPVITGVQPVAPSAITPDGEVFTQEGMKPFTEPRALETAELPGVVAELANCLAQSQALMLGKTTAEALGEARYITITAEARQQAYQAMAGAIGADKVGIRVSPGGTFNAMVETEVEQTYAALVEGLAPLGLAYLHITEGPETSFGEALAKQFGGIVIASTAFTGDSSLATAQETVDTGHGDLFAIGRDFIANPDLVQRLRTGAPLNEQCTELFYGGGAEGYTDYPSR